MKDDYLFIGGKKDGQWLSISDDLKQAHFPVYNLEPSVVPSRGEKPEHSETYDIEVYSRHEFNFYDGTAVFYLLEGVGLFDAFSSLLAAYGDQHEK